MELKEIFMGVHTRDRSQVRECWKALCTEYGHADQVTMIPLRVWFALFDDSTLPEIRTHTREGTFRLRDPDTQIEETMGAWSFGIVEANTQQLIIEHRDNYCPERIQPQKIRSFLEHHGYCASVLNRYRPIESISIYNTSVWIRCRTCQHWNYTALYPYRLYSAPSNRCGYCRGTALCGHRECNSCSERTVAKAFLREDDSELPSSKLQPSGTLNLYRLKRGSRRRIRLRCRSCQHISRPTIRQVQNGITCAYCSSKRRVTTLCGDRSCNPCYKKSLAAWRDDAHHMRVSFDQRNGPPPWSLTLGSHKKAWFRCTACQKEILRVIYKTTQYRFRHRCRVRSYVS